MINGDAMQEKSKFNKYQCALDVDREFVRGDVIDFLSRLGVNSTNTDFKEHGWIASMRQDIAMIIFPTCHHDKMIIAFRNDDFSVNLAVYDVKLIGSSRFEYGDGDDQ